MSTELNRNLFHVNDSKKLAIVLKSNLPAAAKPLAARYKFRYCLHQDTFSKNTFLKVLYFYYENMIIHNTIHQKILVLLWKKTFMSDNLEKTEYRKDLANVVISEPLRNNYLHTIMLNANFFSYFR